MTLVTLYKVDGIPEIKFKHGSPAVSTGMRLIMQKMKYKKAEIDIILKAKQKSDKNIASHQWKIVNLVLRTLLKSQGTTKEFNKSGVLTKLKIVTSGDTKIVSNTFEKILKDYKTANSELLDLNEINDLRTTPMREKTSVRRVPTSMSGTSKRISFDVGDRPREVDQIEKIDEFNDPRISLAASAMAYNAFPDSRIGQFRLISNDADIGVIYYDPNNNVLLIAFVGSKSLMEAAKNAVKSISSGSSTAELQAARGFLLFGVDKFPSAKVILAGHSWGAFIASIMGREVSVVTDSPTVQNLLAVHMFNPGTGLSYKLIEGEEVYITPGDIGGYFLNDKANIPYIIFVIGGARGHSIINFIKGGRDGFNELLSLLNSEYPTLPPLIIPKTASKQQAIVSQDTLVDIIDDDLRGDEVLKRLGLNPKLEREGGEVEVILNALAQLNPTAQEAVLGISNEPSQDLPQIEPPAPGETLEPAKTNPVPEPVVPADTIATPIVQQPTVPITITPATIDDKSDATYKPKAAIVVPLGTPGYTSGVLTEKVGEAFRPAVRSLFTRYNISITQYAHRNSPKSAKTLLKEVTGSHKLSMKSINDTILAIRMVYGPLIGVPASLDLTEYQPVSVFRILVALVTRYRELSKSKPVDTITSASTDDEILQAAGKGLIIAPTSGNDADVIQKIRSMLPTTSATPAKLDNIKDVEDDVEPTKSNKVEPIFQNLKYPKFDFARTIEIQELPKTKLYNFNFKT